MFGSSATAPSVHKQQLPEIGYAKTVFNMSRAFKF